MPDKKTNPPTKVTFATRLAAVPKLAYENREYIRVDDFATLSRHSRRTLSGLVLDGNRYGRLKAVRLLGKTWIPVEELFEFVFTEPGRYGRAYNLSKPGGEIQWRLEDEGEDGE